ncbi:MAG TPA: Crp/Fnr family transcriptional regulator [Streptosporangiaceae bacterium]|nr:Crp/Fnr family transcriptional regulator [Streptosporangiaceae bacterium]
MDDVPADWVRAIEASFLGRLPERTWRLLFDRAHQIDAPLKTVLYPETEQEPTAHLVLVVDGLVRVYRTSRSGREVTIRYARRGDILGLPSVVAQASPAAAQAVVPTRVVAMSAQVLRSRAQRDSQLAWAMAEEMAGSLFNIQERLAHNVFAPVRSRVARYLLDVATPARDSHTPMPGPAAKASAAATARDAATPGQVATASYEDIAAAIGTVREVVARTLAGLRDDGLIRRTEAGIALIDLDGLRDAAQADEFRDFRRR